MTSNLATQNIGASSSGSTRSRSNYIYNLGSATLILAYLTIYAFFRGILPEKWSVDSAKIIEILASGASGDIDNSFGATAAFFAAVGVDNLDFFTCGTSVIFLIFASRDIRTFKQFTYRWLLIAPCIMLNMFAPSKETIVLLMTMCITAVSYYFRRSKYLTFGALVLLYSIYGLVVRQYYLIILSVFFVVYYLWHKRSRYTVAVSLIVLAALLAAPSGLLQTLQSPRDTSNAYAESIGSDNRTAFYNVLPPTTGPAFLVNYFYAGSVLLLPIVYFHTPTDIFMQGVIAGILLMLYRAKVLTRKRQQNYQVRFYASLVLAHIFVQLIFEPDLGSFTRHLTSVILYLISMQLAYKRLEFK